MESFGLGVVGVIYDRALNRTSLSCSSYQLPLDLLGVFLYVYPPSLHLNPPAARIFSHCQSVKLQTNFNFGLSKARWTCVFYPQKVVVTFVQPHMHPSDYLLDAGNCGLTYLQWWCFNHSPQKAQRVVIATATHHCPHKW